MKRIYIILAFVFTSAFLFGQKEKNSLLKYPETWKSERINFPLDFAKDIHWKGFEELRFAPGMFKTEAKDYFTYTFIIKREANTPYTEDILVKFLNTYYKGLCKVVNANDKFPIDYNKIKASVKKETATTFTADIVFFDSFTDGRNVNLKMYIESITTKTGIVLLSSVAPKAIPKELIKIHYKNKKSLGSL